MAGPDIIPILAVFKNFYLGIFSIPLFHIGNVIMTIGHLLIGGPFFMLVIIQIFRIFADGFGTGGVFDASSPSAEEMEKHRIRDSMWADRVERWKSRKK